MNPTLNPGIYALDLRAKPKAKILKGTAMKALIGHEIRIVPVYRDHKGVYTMHLGKRVYMQEVRGILYPVD